MDGRLLVGLSIALCAACEAPSSPSPSATVPPTQQASGAAPTLDKRAGCQALIAVVNRSVEESRKITGTLSGDGTQELEALAAAATRARAEVETLAVDDPAVQGARDGYLTMLSTTIQAAKATLAAAKDKDFEAMEKAGDALTKAVASEEAVVSRINAACGVGPTPTP